MNCADVIRLAQEAGMETHPRKGEIRICSAVFTGSDSTEQVERFAALVEAETLKAHQQAIEAAVLEEREAITNMVAKEADEWFKDWRVYGDSASNDKGETLRDLENKIIAGTQPMRIDDAHKEDGP